MSIKKEGPDWTFFLVAINQFASFDIRIYPLQSIVKSSLVSIHTLLKSIPRQSTHARK